MHRLDNATLRVGAQDAATARGRVAIADAAALLSLHGHRVTDLAAGSRLGRAMRAVTGGRDRRTAYDVLIGDGSRSDGDHPETVRLTTPDGVELTLAGRPGLAGRLDELARLVRADGFPSTPTGLTA